MSLNVATHNNVQINLTKCCMCVCVCGGCARKKVIMKEKVNEKKQGRCSCQYFIEYLNCRKKT